eukprot:10130498-Alexandrium_andersonii.AAC.1
MHKGGSQRAQTQGGGATHQQPRAARQPPTGRGSSRPRSNRKSSRKATTAEDSAPRRGEGPGAAAARHR